MSIFLILNDSSALFRKFNLQFDLCNSLKQSSDLGLTGAIIWSTSYGMTISRCLDLSNYVINRLGPYMTTVIARAKICSNKNCLR